MKRILLLVLFLATLAGALVAAGMNREAVDTFLTSRGIDPESEWFEQALRLVFTIVVGLPVAALLWSLMALGQGKVEEDIHGYTTLRLKPGMRVTLPVLSLGLAGLMFFGAHTIEGAVAQLFIQGFGVVFLWAAWMVWSARVKFNGTTLMAPNLLGMMRSYDWADLMQIRTLDESREYLLIFHPKRRVKISFFYAGVDRLVWQANQKRQANARAA